MIDVPDDAVEDEDLDLPVPPDLEPLLPRLPILDLPAFTEVKRGPYTHTISATRWSPTGVAEVLLKFGPTLRGAVWAPLSKVRRLDGSLISLVNPDPQQHADDASIAAEERYWADQRLARQVDALTPNPRR